MLQKSPNITWLCHFITCCLLLTAHTALAISCAGCVDLDELNFDPTIVRFPYALVKFDIAFPYGEKHEAFADFSKAAHKVTSGELLVATVGIKDYGEMENKALGLRFGFDEKSFPGIVLYKGSVKDYVTFPAHLDVTVDNLKEFVTKNTELYIGRDGCLKEFNEYARKFANKDNAEQLALIAAAEAEAKQLESKDIRRYNAAKIYLTFMRKINEKGYNFVEEETKRLQRLRAGKVTTAKKEELQQRLNVLESFRVTKLTKGEETQAEKEEEALESVVDDKKKKVAKPAKQDVDDKQKKDAKQKKQDVDDKKKKDAKQTKQDVDDKKKKDTKQTKQDVDDKKKKDTKQTKQEKAQESKVDDKKKKDAKQTKQEADDKKKKDANPSKQDL